MKKIRDIVQDGDSVLRKKAKDVPFEEISSPRVRKILEHMKKALARESDGVAIAAPQIGEPLRIFVIAGKVFSGELKINSHDRRKQKITSQEPDRVFINPQIIRRSRKKVWVPEGCLSVRWWYGETERSGQATVQALDEKGKQFTMGGSGLLAQIFQHETDHLNGILFTDHARNAKKLSESEIKKMEEEILKNK
jgi:peptide deformylase